MRGPELCKLCRPTGAGLEKAFLPQTPASHPLRKGTRTTTPAPPTYPHPAPQGASSTPVFNFVLQKAAEARQFDTEVGGP